MFSLCLILMYTAFQYLGDVREGGNITIDDTCMTSWTNWREKSPNVPCTFPFRYNGKMYYQCIHDSFGPWCSTKVTSAGDHDGHWGFCGSGCPATESA